MIELTIYLIISVLLSLFIFRIFLINDRYVSIYDIPDSRKIHSEKILKVGGIGIILTFLLLLSFYRFLNQEFLLYMNKLEGQVFLATMFLIMGGLIDDIVGINAPKKLFFQVIAVSIIINSGFLFDLFSYDLINIIFSMVFYIIVINSINLIDGIDGLSSGIFILFAISMVSVFMHLSIIDPKYYIIISIFMGSVVGFFIINFPPAKLFLGDVGSQLLGWVLAVSIIYLSLQFENNALKIFLLSFISLPFYDVFFVAFKRFSGCRNDSIIKRFASIVHADKKHIHHLLLRYGFSSKQSLLILLLFYFLNLAICILSFFVIGAYTFTFIFVLILNIALRTFFEYKIKD